MAVRIRLRRMGAKKQPHYRLVVADSRSPRDGRFLDTIGTYNPRTEPADINIDRDKALEWLEKGAEPSDSARSLLSQIGVWQRFKTGEWPVERPRPEPVVAPAPAPESEPTLEPAPAPEPEPTLEPAPAPEPAPVPEPAPAPEPVVEPATEVADDAEQTTEG